VEENKKHKIEEKVQVQKENKEKNLKRRKDKGWR
jgi:hypothetical protein